MSAPTEFFEGLFAEHGDSPRALDWSHDGQRERFRVLAEIGTLHGSVLDVGCGLGHLYDYLRSGYFRGAYLGIDRSSQLLDAARERLTPSVAYHAPSANFAAMDALTTELPPADFVVSSGMLNIEQGNNDEQMEVLIDKCFAACRVGCAINMLSVNASPRRDGRHYFGPATMLAHAFSLTRRVTLRHDYRPNDFTLYLYKDRP